jgi:hypothetical protein
MISHGLPPRDNDVQRELADLRRQLRQMHGMIVQAITGDGGITINGGFLQALYDDGLTSVLLGTFRTYDGSFNPVDGNTGLRILADSTYAGIGYPNIQPSIVDLFKAPDGSVDASLTVSSLNVFSTGAVELYGDNNNAFVKIDTSGNVILSPASGAHVQAFVGTTANAANAYVDASSGNLSRSTSSRRYKQDIADAALDPEALLQLTPRRFRAKAEVDEHGDDAPEHLGFIAEEAADLGLEQFVTRDDEGPEAFSYAGYVVGLQAIVRHQAEQIADLTARLERLEQAGPHEEG